MAARTALRLLLWAALSGAVAQAPTAAVTATAGPSCSDSLFTYEHPPFALPAMSLRLSVALCEGDVVEDVVAAAFADAPVNVELDAQLIASVVDGVRNALAAGHADVATLSAVHVVRRPAPSGVEVPAGVEVRTPSNLHKWRDTYARDGVERVQREALYGDDFSYREAQAYFEGCEVVQDWGCGRGAFRRFMPQGALYRGVDGSAHPLLGGAVHEADLAAFTPEPAPDCLLVRHVIEHNMQWKQVLFNAASVATDRLFLVVYTPWAADGAPTQVLTRNTETDVPQLALSFEEVEEELARAARAVERRTRGRETLQWAWQRSVSSPGTAWGEESICRARRVAVARSAL